MATCVHYLTALSSVPLPLDSTCEEEAETPFLKIKAPRLNFWTISEAPARNLDCSFSLPSIMHLSRRHTFTSNHQVTGPSYTGIISNLTLGCQRLYIEDLNWGLGRLSQSTCRCISSGLPTVQCGQVAWPQSTSARPR